MTVFVDTSAILAIAERLDANHQSATGIWSELIRNGETLVVSNYVLLEAWSLIQRHLGLPALQSCQHDVVPVFQIEWVGADVHAAATQALLAANQRQLSLVDYTSFVTMRRLGLRRVFAYDDHFRRQGFTCLP